MSSPDYSGNLIGELMKMAERTCPADVLYDPCGYEGGICGAELGPDEDFCKVHKERE